MKYHPFFYEISACVQSAMSVGDLDGQQASQFLAMWHRYLIHPKAKP